MHAQDLEAFELCRMKTCTILLATIAAHLITCIEDIDDNPPFFWINSIDGSIIFNYSGNRIECHLEFAKIV